MGISMVAKKKDDSKPQYAQATEAAAALVVAATELKVWVGSTPLNKVQILNALRECQQELREVDYPATTLGPELVTNGGFDADTDWTKGTGWTIAAGVASSDGTQVADSDLTQALSLTNGEKFRVTFTVLNYVAGNVTPVAAGTEGTDRAANGTFVETITAGAGGDLDIRADLNFVGDVDIVSCVQSEGFEVVALHTPGLGSENVIITNQAALPIFAETNVAVLYGSDFAVAASSLHTTHLIRLIEKFNEDVLKAA